MQGFTPELLKKITSIIGVELKMVKISDFSTLNEMINKQEVSMFSAVVKSKKRLEFLNFSDYYLTLKTSLCSHKERPYNKLHLLKGKKLVIVKGFALSEFLAQDYPQIDFIEVNSAKEALELLSNKKADAYLDATLPLSYMLKNSNYKKLTLYPNPEYNLKLALSVSKKDEVLLEILQKTLFSLQEYEINALKERWFLQNPFESRHIFIKLLILISLLLLFSYIYILKSEKYR